MVGAEGKRCTHCGSSHSSSYWRNHPTSGHRLCNACRKYAERNSGQLPPDSVLQRRSAQPRRMADVRKEMAQRRCLTCGSASPGAGKRPQWYRHPATGEEWLCGTCNSRARRQLKKQQRHDAHAAAEEEEEEEQSRHSSGEAGSAEGKQAPSPRLPPASLKRRHEQQGCVDQTPAAFHDGPADAAKRRAEGQRRPAARSSGGASAAEAGQQETAAGGGGKAPLAAATRRQRRKQAQPQHLPPNQQAAVKDDGASLAPTVLVEGASDEAASSEGPAAASLYDSLAAGTAGAPPAAAAEGATLPVQQQAAMAAQPHEVPAEPEADQSLLQLLEQAMDVAAAAASGLTPEVVAAFAALLPLDGPQVSMASARVVLLACSCCTSAQLAAARHP